MKKIIVFFVILILASVVFYLVHPSPLTLNYEHFADARPFLGIPHFLNVVSNLFFLFAALLGFFFVWKDKRLFSSKVMKGLAYLFFAALFLTGIGSTYFHWKPERFTLLFDRLPIAVTFTAFYSLLLTQRVQPKVGSLLAPLFILVGIFSVFYWYCVGDLRPYVLVQSIPLLSIPLITLFFRSAIFKDRYLLIAFALYLVALLLDLMDAQVFHFTKNTISGHTLKHLFGATGSFFLLIYLVDRKKAKI